MERQGSAPIYDVIAEREVMVAMRDGVRLATDLYFPALGGKRAPGRFPVLLERTPYNKHGLGAVRRPSSSRGMAMSPRCRMCAAASPRKGNGTPSRSKGRTATIPSSGSARRTGATARSARWASPTPAATSTPSPRSHPPHLAAMFASEAMANYHTGSMRQGGAMELRFMIYAFHHGVGFARQAQANPALQAAVKRELG